MKKNRLVLKSFLLILILLSVSCKSKAERLADKKRNLLKENYVSFQQQLAAQNQQQTKILSDYVAALPLELRIAQLFIENLEGNTKFRSYENFDKITGRKEDSKRPVIAGGYLFFNPNLCETPEEQRAFIQTIYDYTSENHQLKPFLAIDQEGGWVNRLKKLTGGLPSQEKAAQNYDVSQAYNLYADQAVKMKKLGFTMNLAPVMEICTRDNQDFLDGRSFGTLRNVINYGRACINAYENNDIAAVVKHFPGNTNTDPHVGLPVITLEKPELEKAVEGFKQILDYNPTGILMSHAITSCIDDKTPSCLSEYWVTKVIREEYGYKGIVFSDDIFMGALADHGFPPEKACVMAIEAGIDCIMTSEKRFAGPAKVLYKKAMEEPAFEQRINESVERLLSYKLKAGIISYDDLTFPSE